MAGTPPRPLLIDALERFESESNQSGMLAIDFGCGEGRDTIELLRRGWRVLAIDAEREAFERLLARDDLTNTDRLQTRLASFDHVDLPPCRLVNAAFSLPFCPPDRFLDVWRRITDAIEPGGRFVGQFFGDRDDWAALPDRSHHGRDEVEWLLMQFEVEHFQEEERDGADALGFAKHWHVFHIIAGKSS